MTEYQLLRRTEREDSDYGAGCHLWLGDPTLELCQSAWDVAFGDEADGAGNWRSAATAHPLLYTPFVSTVPATFLTY